MTAKQMKMPALVFLQNKIIFDLDVQASTQYEEMQDSMIIDIH